MRRWRSVKPVLTLAIRWSCRKKYSINNTNGDIIDFQGRCSEPDQAGHEKGQAAICAQLFPSQRLLVELRGFSPGTVFVVSML